MLELAAPGRVEVAVFDAGGRRVSTLLAGRLEAGHHPVVWDGEDATGARAPAGVYFVRAIAPDGAARRRLVRVE
jgi:flagellar hook assembly protein FlgD